MAKKRDRLKVIYDILKTIKFQGKTKPTHILYKSNLSHSMMKEYLKELIEKKLIEKVTLKNSTTYSITTKGNNYVQEYQSMINFMKSFGLEN